jgi:large subunit ribosomal protein L12
MLQCSFSVSNVLKAAGIAADTVRVKAIVASLSEVDIEEAIKSAPTIMASPPTAQPTIETEEKPKKEEKKPEDEKEKEDAALEGLGALFG